ncbi:hypothetical protein [Sphingobium sp. Cam5-1]|uniref:hypothetical protein n=1 Tax=Sphingobium sp. Cam5-1 TaxID=2789327 RepID=UPI001E4303E6|nr:hypothetical protein [Sphingobium sp. Cam5-1]
MRQMTDPGRGWRLAPWAAIAIILMVPLVAMRFTDEVRWTGHDFLVAGVLLVSAVLIYQVGARLITGRGRRLLWAGAIFIVTMLLWAEGAVGIFS